MLAYIDGMIKAQVDRMARALVPVLEDEIVRLKRLVDASRGSIFQDDFAYDLARHERALAAIICDHL